MSDEAFEEFYRTAGASFGKLTHAQNGYGTLMGANIPNTSVMRNRTGADRYSGYFGGTIRR